LLNARREADKIREQLAEARAEADAMRRERPSEPDPIGTPSVGAPHIDLTALHAADALAAQRIAEAEKWSKEHIAEADEIGTQRILEAENRANEILSRARAQAAAVASPSDEDPPWARVRPWPDERSSSERPAPDVPTLTVDRTDAVVVDSGRETGRSFPLGRTTRVVLLVVATVIGSNLLRSCIAEPYTVASTSMEPEFHDGDRLVVNKLAYRFGDVRRSDIVVIETHRVSEGTERLGETLVKRVVGLPGDVVQAVDGRVLINGEPLDEPWLDGAQTAAFGPVQVPEDALFVLGDARDVSIDSRSFGPVPVDAVVGRVDAVIWPPGDAGKV
jgi:signal peptidase I